MWAGERESRAAGKNSRKDGKDGWKREREDDRVGGGEEKKRKSGIGKEGDRVWKRGRRSRATGSLQSETGRYNLLTVLLCYQQKGSRY